MGRVIVFDLIGVLAGPSWRELVAAPQLEAWRRLRVGAIAEEAFWDAEARRIYRAALGVRRDRVEVVERLRRSGLVDEVVVATNYAREWGAAIRERMPAGVVDRWAISGELGVAKPDPEFWRRLAVPPGTVVVDDQAENVASASRSGLRGVLAAPGVDLEAAVLRALLDDRHELHNG